MANTMRQQYKGEEKFAVSKDITQPDNQKQMVSHGRVRCKQIRRKQCNGVYVSVLKTVRALHGLLDIQRGSRLRPGRYQDNIIIHPNKSTRTSNEEIGTLLNGTAERRRTAE